MSRPVADIQADLVVAYAARRNALNATDYTLNSLQGSQSIKRDLKQIRATISELEAELAEADGTAGGIVFATVDRGAL